MLKSSAVFIEEMFFDEVDKEKLCIACETGVANTMLLVIIATKRLVKTLASLIEDNGLLYIVVYFTMILSISISPSCVVVRMRYVPVVSNWKGRV